MNREKTRDLVLASIFIGIIILMTLVPQIGYIILPGGAALTLIHIPVLLGIFILKPKYGIAMGLVFGLSSWTASFLYATNPVDLAFRNPMISVVPRILFGLAAFGIFTGFKKLSTLKYGKEMLFGIIAVVTIFVAYYGTLALIHTFGGDQVSLLTNIFVPLSFVLAGVLIAVFYAYIHKQYDQALAVPATFAISTLIHTLLVLSFLFLFSQELEAYLGNDLIALLGVVIAGNGFLEILLAVVIGTPIYITLRKLVTEEN